MKVAISCVALFACAATMAACGTDEIRIAKSSPYYHGAVAFREHCSGCHSLSAVGAQGSATSIGNRVRTNGPDFNIRRENIDQVLYAIRNGGFSGAIMPENIVVGGEAQAIAAFLATYSGKSAEHVPSVSIPPSK